jgi:hypothetical protein
MDERDLLWRHSTTPSCHSRSSSVRTQRGFDFDRLTVVICIALLASGLTACGSSSSQNAEKTRSICRSVHENTVLFDKVLIGKQPASNFPESTLTPVDVVTRKLGEPDQTYQLQNVLFSWWRYDNTAYMVADLAANVPGHQYIAAKSCDWKYTQERIKALLHSP